VAVRAITPADLDWMVERLARRRRALTDYAPVYWRRAPDAEPRHRAFLGFLLGEGGAIGVRTRDGFLLAQPRDLGWLVDDAVVPADRWASDGVRLWESLREDLDGSVRWVCPVPETPRRDFVAGLGLDLVESWWHRDVIGAPSAVVADVPADGVADVVGAAARLVLPPPIYSPGGPVLFLTDVQDPAAALGAALHEARSLGSPVVVVSQPADDEALVGALEAHDFRRHCDFLEGWV
jgi:hypothetical protein